MKHQSRSQYTKYGGPAVSRPRCPISGETIEPGEGIHVVVKDRNDAARSGRSFTISMSVLKYWGFTVENWLKANNYYILPVPIRIRRRA